MSSLGVTATERSRSDMLARSRRLLVAEARARLENDPFRPTPPDDETARLLRELAAEVAPVPATEAASTHAPEPLVPPRRVAHREGGRDRSARGRSAVRPPGPPRTLRPPRSHAPAARTAPRSSADEDEVIVATMRTLTAKAQATRLGRPYAWVVSRRMALARAGRIDLDQRAYQRPWTRAEEQYLREHIGREPIADIARALDRTPTAVMLHRKRARIATQRESTGGMNASEVARILGVDVHAVTHELIAWGLLAARRVPFIRSGGHATMWLIEREALVDMLLDHPWQYDRTRIRDPFFRRVADQAWSRDPLLTSDEAAAELGLGAGHAFVHLVTKTLPRIMPPGALVIHRRGRPGLRGRSLAGQPVLAPRSTIRAIKASGWVNYRALARDPDRLSAERAAALVRGLPDAPRWLGRAMAAERARRFYACGAIPTQEVRPSPGRRVLVARRADVLALKDAFFARASAVLRLTPRRRALIERHDPSWLARPRDLALALADGRLATLLARWREAERDAAAALRATRTTRFALVSMHLLRTIALVGPRTRLRGRTAVYHLFRHGGRLEQIPLATAKRHDLRPCPSCAHRSRADARRASARPRPVSGRDRATVITCAQCGTGFARPVGRPARVPRCRACRGLRAA